jgi:serine/threonine protein kinase
MEYHPEGSLRRYMRNFHKSPSSFKWEHRYSIGLGILEGLVFLKSLNLIHRDIKSPNILLDEALKPRIADFGLACSGLSGTRVLGNPQGDTPKGTDGYIAPEIYDPSMIIDDSEKHDSPYWFPSDLYAAMVILWELTALEEPRFNSFDQAKQVTLLGSDRVSTFKEYVHRDLQALIRDGWKLNRQERPTVEEAHKRLIAIRDQDKEADTNMFRLAPRPSPAEGQLLPNNHAHRAGLYSNQLPFFSGSSTPPSLIGTSASERSTEHRAFTQARNDQ